MALMNANSNIPFLQSMLFFHQLAVQLIRQTSSQVILPEEACQAVKAERSNARRVSWVVCHLKSYSQESLTTSLFPLPSSSQQARANFRTATSPCQSLPVAPHSNLINASLITSKHEPILTASNSSLLKILRYYLKLFDPMRAPQHLHS